jgi:hypothetical protein
MRGSGDSHVIAKERATPEQDARDRVIRMSHQAIGRITSTDWKKRRTSM